MHITYKCRNSPFLRLVFHSSASSGQDASLIASVRSTEPSKGGRLNDNFTAGPLELKDTKLLKEKIYIIPYINNQFELTDLKDHQDPVIATVSLMSHSVLNI